MRRAEQLRYESQQRGLSQGIRDVQNGFDALDEGISEYFRDFGTIYVKNDTKELV